MDCEVPSDERTSGGRGETEGARDITLAARNIDIDRR